ncbi:hypothetical protein IG631_09007 [Alternaria alternata]|jgi:hypothetical protein|nr:hypothetical protein IG631_09007 [Alternaria alternata]
MSRVSRSSSVLYSSCGGGLLHVILYIGVVTIVSVAVGIGSGKQVVAMRGRHSECHLQGALVGVPQQCVSIGNISNVAIRLGPTLRGRGTSPNESGRRAVENPR